jgi:hypothetical protein
MKAPVATLLFAMLLTVQAPAQSQDATCEVNKEQFVPGGTSSATMVMVNDGKPCQFRFRFGGQNPPDNWELVTPPQSGQVQFNEDVAEYHPNPGFTGTDKFVVAVFGRSPGGKKRDARNGRFEVAVTVKSKS